ncbi:hypothetical protein [Bacillus alkalicellulosilyticus]|uniref:hypothetical protein n=1 Tax=Alkalihalobacterium alkalicellulosilyticum TaxID=1912214 RepID=UPI000998C4CD|nr:hypothetical protein [Bacillus alkalicellulosilyticus]
MDSEEPLPECERTGVERKRSGVVTDSEELFLERGKKAVERKRNSIIVPVARKKSARAVTNKNNRSRIKGEKSSLGNE